MSSNVDNYNEHLFADCFTACIPLGQRVCVRCGFSFDMIDLWEHKVVFPHCKKEEANK